MDTREFCKKFAAKSAKLDPKDVEIRRARVITEIQSLLDETKPLTVDNINEVMTSKVLNGLRTFFLDISAVVFPNFCPLGSGSVYF